MLCMRLQSVNSESLRDDKEIRKFFITLVKNHLDTTGPLLRIDLLSCPVAQSTEGKILIEELRQLVEVCLSVCTYVSVCVSVRVRVCVCPPLRETLHWQYQHCSYVFLSDKL